MQENIRRNFGMPQPNGYRKALRFMRHADKFGLPIITFVDTPGAYAGKNAEELGQVRHSDSCNSCAQQAMWVSTDANSMRVFSSSPVWLVVAGGTRRTSPCLQPIIQGKGGDVRGCVRGF